MYKLNDFYGIQTDDYSENKHSRILLYDSFFGVFFLKNMTVEYEQ